MDRPARTGPNPALITICIGCLTVRMAPREWRCLGRCMEVLLFRSCVHGSLLCPRPLSVPFGASLRPRVCL